MSPWVDRLLADPELVRMGHGQRVEDANLGLGWVYYGLARALRPSRVVVIGSWRGFVPLVFGKALTDNLEKGEVTFIDPSLVDDFWKRSDQVDRHFARFEVANVRHFCMTTQEFTGTEAFRDLGEIGILFIDGMHTFDQVRTDFESFKEKLAPEGVVLFHDSLRIRKSGIYGADRAYEHRVKDFMDVLRRDPSLELFSLAVGEGVTLVRRRSS